MNWFTNITLFLFLAFGLIFANALCLAHLVKRYELHDPLSMQ